jgi:SAM-dependent methyltransferase
MTAPPAPTLLAETTMQAVRRRLAELGWTEDVTAARLGIRSLAELARADRLGETALDPIGLLCRAFLLDEQVPRDALLSLLGSRVTSALERMHLLTLGPGALAACPLNLFPCEGLYLVTDKKGLHPTFNQVMWLYPECWYLARLAVRRPTERALDLCTGSGIHALLARRFARHVVAVDTNPRAVAFAEYNRALNGIDRVSFLLGDLYGPVAELERPKRRFGSILANPPYHPVLDSKAGENAYSGGETGEEILEGVVRGLAKHLRAGGVCQIVTLVIHREGIGWRDKLQGWLGKGGFEVALLTRAVPYPSSLQTELVRLKRQDPAAVDRSWKAQRITGFAFGLLTIRRTRKIGQGSYVEGPFRP